MDIREIKARLNRQVETVCDYLLPGGRRVGHEWVQDPGSGKIKVHLSGDKAGVWSHWGGEGSGDIIDLWCAQRRLTLKQSLVEIKTYLGIEDPAFTGSSKRQYRRPTTPKSRPAKAGTAVEIYLRGERAISREIMTLFKIGQADAYVTGEGHSVEGPWILFPYIRKSEGHNELINIKWLHVSRRPDEKGGKPKKRVIQEKDAEPCLFGWQAIDDTARAVIICEGEIDAMTWRQCGFFALSVPAGAGVGHKNDWIDAEWERLDRFEECFLSFDQDDEGKKAVLDVIGRLGAHRCRIITLPHKDINECYAGHGMTIEEIQPYVTEAKSLTPDELRSARFFVEQVLDEFYPQDELASGYALPFRFMRDFRMRMGETTTVTGINGHGKSAIVSQIALHLVENGARCMVASMEMRPSKTLERMTRQVAGELKPSVQHIRAIFDWYDGRMWIYNVHGSTKVDRLLEVMLYARRRFGINVFVIDSLMRCGIAFEDYEAQDRFVRRLCEFDETESTHTVLIAHSRKGQDEKHPVGKLDIKGSGGITDNAFNCLSVWRNKPKELKLQELRENKALGAIAKMEREADLLAKPDAILICDKQRHGTGWEGRARLWFSPESVQYRDSQTDSKMQLRSAPDADDHPIEF